jgi:AcrR family transcriptional regulator
MSPRTSEQFKKIREDKKNIILRAALEEFAEKSFQGASISAIAKRAGISKGLVYNYFLNKEDLLEQIINKAWDSISGLFPDNNKNGLSPYEFQDIIDMNFELLKKDYRFWKLYFSIAMQPASIKFLEKKMPEFISEFLNVFVTYYKQKGSANPEAEAILLGAVLDGVSLNYILNPDTFPINEVKQMIIEKFK